MKTTRRNNPSVRTVVILDSKDRATLQGVAKAENISASEVIRKALRAYTDGSAKQEEAALHGLLAEMNAALDAALSTSRAARSEIRKDLDRIKTRSKASKGAAA